MCTDGVNNDVVAHLVVCVWNQIELQACRMRVPNVFTRALISMNTTKASNKLSVYPRILSRGRMERDRSFV
jgi:hypothetical protein